MVDASPLPATAKRAIKSCRGCSGRAQSIDRAERAVKKFFGVNQTQEETSHAPQNSI